MLACPVGMGAMMWLMMRGRKSDQRSSPESALLDSAQPASLELLREEHNRLSDEIERLEQRQAKGGEKTEHR